MNIGIIERKKTAFLLIDLQEKFVPVINDILTVSQNSQILVNAAKILDVPLLTTEQYPKALGKTIKHVPVDDTIEKIHFSCFGSPEFCDRLKELKVKHLVIFGVEAHVCVLKTALDALKKGFTVHVVADATSSRTMSNKALALQRLTQSGAFIVSTEMILFQLLDKAGTKEFKEISKLIK